LVGFFFFFKITAHLDEDHITARGIRALKKRLDSTTEGTTDTSEDMSYSPVIARARHHLADDLEESTSTVDMNTIRVVKRKRADTTDDEQSVAAAGSKSPTTATTTSTANLRGSTASVSISDIEGVGTMIPKPRRKSRPVVRKQQRILAFWE